MTGKTVLRPLQSREQRVDAHCEEPRGFYRLGRGSARVPQINGLYPQASFQRACLMRAVSSCTRL